MWKSRQIVRQVNNLTPGFQYYLVRELKDDITLTSPIAVDDTVFNVSAGHGFQIGDMLTIFDNSIVSQFTVVSIATNAITVSMPSCCIIPIENAAVVRGIKEMNTATLPETYTFKLRSSIIPVNIKSVIISLTHSATPDDGKFGGIAALTNGLYARQKNGRIFNLNNYKRNADFKEIGAKVTYTDKGAGGVNGTDIIIDIKNSFDRFIPVNPLTGDEFFVVKRDDFSELASATISINGYYAIGE